MDNNNNMKKPLHENYKIVPLSAIAQNKDLSLSAMDYMSKSDNILKGLDLVCHCLLNNCKEIEETGYSFWPPDCAFALSDIVETIEIKKYPYLHKFLECIDEDELKVEFI